MIPLTELREESFPSIEALGGRLAHMEVEDHVVPMAGITLEADGLLRLGSVRVALSEPGYHALLRRLRIPSEYATDVCDAELLADSVNRLARRDTAEARFHVVEGKIVNVTKPEYKAVANRPLVAYCASELAQAASVILTASRLSVTVTSKVPREVLPSDTFEYGWELTNCAAGSVPLEVRGYALRLICLNGMVARCERGGYRLMPSEHFDLPEVLHTVRGHLGSDPQMGLFDRGLRRASEMRVGEYLSELQATLRRALGADGYESRFRELAEETTWYEVHNTLTAAARMYTVAGRRMLETLAGDLVEWLAGGQSGRSGRRWGLRASRCDGCVLRKRQVAEGNPQPPGA